MANRPPSAFARSAARYLVVLGLLPRSSTDRCGSSVIATSGRFGTCTATRATPPHPRTRWRVESCTDGPGVEVTGHIKRQRHGPGRAQTKWIYIASYEARRWVGPRGGIIDAG